MSHRPLFFSKPLQLCLVKQKTSILFCLNTDVLHLLVISIYEYEPEGFRVLGHISGGRVFFSIE